MTLGLIWAQTPDGVIGREGALPWRLPEDLARFRTLTQGHPVIMGRATWESLPARFRPLPGRDNIVLSRTPGFVAEGARVVASLDDAFALVADRDAWVMGGGAVYAATLPRADRVEVTVVDTTVEGDTWAPPLDDGRWRLVGSEPEDGWRTSSSDGLRFRFESYEPAGA
ncbi:dihydrofolate reductase [Cellulomonas chitinilytica]|uniref:Dihydrofolate reductase n=1 Tax=Cellulomonas chitinilytica TaxID=398759 RepID=A0A919P6H9_9CELL|nr:dihydrofolate reductase [Cellulomonas chitinilytica]GIG21884.1 dihydrofolate reductase [Cellulomonas chitinilytica]